MSVLEFSSDSLREIRAERGMSRQQLADELGCHVSAVSRWENDLRRPNNQAIALMALVLGVSLNDLARQAVAA